MAIALGLRVHRLQNLIVLMAAAGAIANTVTLRGQTIGTQLDF